MLDSFTHSTYRTEFAPWPVSEYYDALRRSGIPEALLLPGELTVYRADGARMSYYLDWPEDFSDSTRAIELRPRSKNSYPQDFRLTVQVREGHAIFTAIALSFWEQRDGAPAERIPIARGYLPLENAHPLQEGAGPLSEAKIPLILGWDIGDTNPARMELIRTLCEGIAAGITARTPLLAPGRVQIDRSEGTLQAVHVNASESVGGMVRALVIEEDTAGPGRELFSRGRGDGTLAYYANVLSPVPGEFGNIVWSTREDAEYFPYRPIRHKPIFHGPCTPGRLPLAVQTLIAYLPDAPAANLRTAPPRKRAGGTN